ncbi:secretin and TonB N-terminal domain-containing protein [bacterium]|nr:secretin and TonB N-terminal domain-containing protein [bacterium]MBU1984946.1 secretin and TonB N-terminal domain-containing protein [bacterium]
MSLAQQFLPRLFRRGYPTPRSTLTMLVVLMAAWVAVIPVQQGSALAQTSLATEEGLSRLVTIDADDAFLPSVLAILAEKSGYNIVTGPGVNKEERVSVHLKDVPIEQAMNLVVRAAGLSYEIVGRSFLVAPAKQLKEQVGLTSYVIELKYTDAPTVFKMLSKFSAEISIDTTGNKLLLITSPKVISDIQRVVEQVDRPALQIVLECRIIEVAVDDEQQLGMDWNRLSQLQTVLMESPVDPNGIRVNNEGTPHLTGLDPSQKGRVPTTMPYFPLETRRLGYWSKQVTAFEVALDLLLKRGRAEVLANSSVATLNNKEATIQVVDEIPYVARSGGVGGQVQIERTIVGVRLAVRPKINSDGFITTEITPELSSIFQFIESGDTQLPWVKRRLTNTTIRIRDGETVIIGGLLGVESTKTVHRVPFLGDLPFVGSLFRHTSDLTRKTDLIIQVTPHILGTGYEMELPPRVKEVEQKFLPQSSDTESESEE